MDARAARVDQKLAIVLDQASACLSGAHHESDPRGDTRCILAGAGVDGLHSTR